MPHDADLIDVLYEDNHILAVNKPAMLATMGVGEDVPSLLKVAREFLKLKYQKPGNVYVGIVSRLDGPVTGVVLLAKTSKAAARLSEAFRSRQVRKVYLAAVEGTPLERAATLEHYLRKDERHRKVHATHAGAEGAQLARLSYRTVRSTGEVSLLEIELETGRKHQIRVQLSKSGHAVVGDRKYGSVRAFPNGIALHAALVELEHPVRREPLTIKAPLPPSWGKDRAVAALMS